MSDKWTLCVVVLANKKPREYKNFYLGISGSEEEAQAMQSHIAKKGFKAEGERFFPDQIETLNLKVAGGETDE